MNAESWQPKTIAQLCERVTSGGTPSRSNPAFYLGGLIPWVKTGELQDEYITHYDERITQLAVDKSSAKILPTNTVLMAMYGATVGALGLLSEPSACNQASCAMIVDPRQCCHRWLFYALLNDRPRVVALATGAAQQNLSGRTIRELEFLVPPLQEQIAIAEVLGALDDKIAANTKLASKADEYVRVGFVSLPVESTKRIGEIVLHHRIGVDPTTIPAATAYVGLEHIPRRSVWLPGSDTADKATSDKSVFKQGDILFGKLRPYFHKVVLADSDGICSTDIIVISSANARLGGFALAAASSDAVIQAVTSSSGGTRMPRTSWQDLASVEVPWPGNHHAFDFSERVRMLSGTVHSLLVENRTLATLRDALLPQLMSGKLRVRDAELALSEVL